MEITPVTLVGRLVRLEPLSLSHIPDLTVAGRNEDVWRYMLYGNIETEEQMRFFVEDLLERQSRGTDLPFTVVHLESGRAIGCTRYLNIDLDNRAVEVGGTWYGASYQRTGVNTECKCLLLRHAFEALGCIRVQLKTDARNLRSQAAIERIGAVREGTLRKHMILPDGVIRDSVFYSILDDEWPQVQKRLETMMNR
jgi:RimJ/RimL family protein N-acetyltransferase